MLESQELDPLEVSSLESPWGTPSRHPSCQALGLEEWLAPRARLGTQRGRGLVHKPQQQQQQLKQQLNMVPREPAFSLASASEVSAFLAGPARFLASEALQGPELQLQRLLLQRRPNTELPEA